MLSNMLNDLAEAMKALEGKKHTAQQLQSVPIDVQSHRRSQVPGTGAT